MWIQILGKIVTAWIRDHEETVVKADLAAGSQPEKLRGWILEEIVLFDIQDPREGHLPGSHAGILRMARGIQFLDMTRRIVVDNDPEWPEHGHCPWGRTVKILTGTILEQCNVDDAVPLGHPNAITEVRITQATRVREMIITVMGGRGVLSGLALEKTLPELARLFSEELEG